MLSGNNGILQRATDAKENTGVAQIKEQINLAYHSALVDGQGKVTEDALEDAMEIEFKDKLVEDEENEGEKKLPSGWLTKPSPDDANKWRITIDGVYLDVPAGISAKVGLEELTGVDFGEKTSQTVENGDDLTIDNEQFRVLSNNGRQITAIPFYNITLNLSNPMQSSTAEKIAFSTTNYWPQGTDEIDMTDNRNNIQQYITAYSTKLSNLTNGKVTARIGKYSEMMPYNPNSDILTPSSSNTGNYWLGSSYESEEMFVYMVYDGGLVSDEWYDEQRRCSSYYSH